MKKAAVLLLTYAALVIGSLYALEKVSELKEAYNQVAEGNESIVIVVLIVGASGLLSGLLGLIIAALLILIGIIRFLFTGSFSRRRPAQGKQSKREISEAKRVRAIQSQFWTRVSQVSVNRDGIEFRFPRRFFKHEVLEKASGSRPLGRIDEMREYLLAPNADAVLDVIQRVIEKGTIFSPQNPDRGNARWSIIDSHLGKELEVDMDPSRGIVIEVHPPSQRPRR